MGSAFIFTPSLTASGNISPATFVTIDSSNDFCVVQSGANGAAIGVSQEGTMFPPGTPSDNGYAATSGYPVTVYGIGSVCMVTLGSGGAVRGNFLKSDASGNAVVSSTAGDYVRAIALESGSAGDRRRVQVVAFNHA